jgi:hypothetical protein
VFLIAQKNPASGADISPPLSGQTRAITECPECCHRFKGKGFDGIDAHWRAKHETAMPYQAQFSAPPPALRHALESTLRAFPANPAGTCRHRLSPSVLRVPGFLEAPRLFAQPCAVGRSKSLAAVSFDKAKWTGCNQFVQVRQVEIPQHARNCDLDRILPGLLGESQ